jgi:hypothetical protein
VFFAIADFGKRNALSRFAPEFVFTIDLQFGLGGGRDLVILGAVCLVALVRTVSKTIALPLQGNALFVAAALKHFDSAAAIWLVISKGTINNPIAPENSMLFKWTRWKYWKFLLGTLGKADNFWSRFTSEGILCTFDLRGVCFTGFWLLAANLITAISAVILPIAFKLFVNALAVSTLEVIVWALLFFYTAKISDGQNNWF